jgi:NDP-sugar pyrophosphorylase family protein
MYIADEKVSGYYEVVFAELVANGSLTFEAVSFDTKPWYEIVTIEDLANAEKLFLSAGDSILEAIPLSNTDSVDHGTAKTFWETTEFLNVKT